MIRGNRVLLAAWLVAAGTAAICGCGSPQADGESSDEQSAEDGGVSAPMLGVDLAEEPNPEDLIDGDSWCNALLVRDQGETVGAQLPGHPCMVTIQPGADDAAAAREFYSYSDDGKLAYNWSCADGTCEVTEYTYESVLNGERFVTHQRTCGADGDVAQAEFRYEVESSADELLVVQTSTRTSSSGETEPGPQVVFDSWGNIVEKRRYLGDTLGYEPNVRNEYTYAEEGKVLTRAEYRGAEPAYFDVYRYDDDDRISRVEAFHANRFEVGGLGESVDGMEPDAVLIYSYDSQGRLVSKEAQSRSPAGEMRRFIRSAYNGFHYDCPDAVYSEVP